MTLNITDDMDIEGDETITLTLATPTGGATIDPDAGTVAVTITDNDFVTARLILLPSDPALRGRFAEGVSGPRDVAQINLSDPAPPGGLDVCYRVAGTGAQPATEGQDYTDPGTAAGSDCAPAGGAQSQIHIAEDATTGRIALDFPEDTVAEGPETFEVELVASTGVLLGSPPAVTGTITDNDPPTAASTVEATTPVVADGTDASTVTVTLRDANGDPLDASGGTVTVTATGPSGGGDGFRCDGRGRRHIHGDGHARYGGDGHGDSFA